MTWTRQDAPEEIQHSFLSTQNPNDLGVSAPSRRKLTVGSLFAGIGGFDLGLERTGGFEVRWQVEIDEYCRRVLEKHWPHVKRYGDIRGVTDVERVDVLCGGFPCQDISNAGPRLGLAGERSGLWSEYVRLIRLVRPRIVIVENVAALLERGMERVLGDLAASGYDAEWDVIPASAVGAPHIRERVWIVAYPKGQPWNVSPPNGIRRFCGFRAGGKFGRQDFGILPIRSSWALYQPAICREDDGLSTRVDRLKSLGNAVVPQIVTWIGQRILDWEAANA